MPKLWIIIAGLLGASAVTIGAFHAHGLEGKLRNKYLPDHPIREGDAPVEPIEKTDQRYREKYDEDKNGHMSREESLAFIAHQMHICDVAVKYQMYHALAVFGIGVLALRGSGKLLTAAAVLMLFGVLGFSGGLYTDVFDIAKLHWSVVPLGGLAMILGWLTLALAGCLISTNIENKSTQ